MPIFPLISINVNFLIYYNTAILTKDFIEQNSWTWGRRYTFQNDRTVLFYIQQKLEDSWPKRKKCNLKFNFPKWIYPWRNLYSLENHTLPLSYLTLFTTLLHYCLCFLFQRVFKILATSFFIKLWQFLGNFLPRTQKYIT